MAASAVKNPIVESHMKRGRIDAKQAVDIVRTAGTDDLGGHGPPSWLRGRPNRH
jgi:hypothetical protein